MCLVVREKKLGCVDTCNRATRASDMPCYPSKIDQPSEIYSQTKSRLWAVPSVTIQISEDRSCKYLIDYLGSTDYSHVAQWELLSLDTLALLKVAKFL